MIIIARWPELMNNICQVRDGLSIFDMPIDRKNEKGIKVMIDNNKSIGEETKDISSKIEYIIECKDVCFKYSEDGPLSLDHVSFKMATGSRTAVVGGSGSGKSTLVKVLTGLYRPTSGEIKINNKDYEKIDMREMISMVPQSVSLFYSRSVMQNLVFNNEPVEKVYKLAEELGMHNVLMALPNGYDTVLSHDGLSGGQIQRIGVLRALIKDAPILIIDEGTSNQDAHNEMRIKELINSRDREQTVILIAHQLSALEGIVDDVIVFDGGKVVEYGNLAQLLDKPDSRFNALFNTEIQQK